VSQESTSVGAPRWGRPGQSKQRCGISRSFLYEIAREHQIFKKYGAATIVDYGKVDKILSRLPNVIPGNKKR